MEQEKVVQESSPPWDRVHPTHDFEIGDIIEGIVESGGHKGTHRVVRLFYRAFYGQRCAMMEIVKIKKDGTDSRTSRVHEASKRYFKKVES